MKHTFQDFLDMNPNCSGYKDNRDAHAVFDLLSQDETIISMVEMADSGKPALSACAKLVETFVEKQQDATIDLTDNFTRTVIGRMVKIVLSPFGYLPSVQKDLPKAAKGKYFTSASCYTQTGEATMKIVKKIEECGIKLDI